MDKKKSILNVSISIGFKILTMVMAILVKRSLILTCGNDVNGVNALYLSIIGMLSVAELGVGSAITFCMYRPIVDGDREKVSALYHLFQRWYLAIGAIIFVCGLALTPFLHHFAKDYDLLNVDLYVTFVLMLISVVLTFLFGAKTALINAYKNNYITTAISSGGIILQNVLQIIVLTLTGSFSAYLICRSVAVLVQWAVTEAISRRMYSGILSKKAKIDPDTRHELSRKIRAMFMHKIGFLLVNTVDSLVISVFVGVVSLGKYSNYTAIQQSMDNVLRLVFSSLTSVVGHMYAENSRATARKYCEAFHVLNFLIGAVFYLGYYAVIDDLVAILFGESLLADRSISFVITLNGFISYMRSSTLIFRDATGTFYNDRWKPLLEGSVNIILSVLLVNYIGVVGVIAATILTNLLICHIIEPFVLYNNAFGHSPWKHYLRNYGMILLFGGSMYLFQLFETTDHSHWINFLLNGFLSVGISLAACAIVLVLNPDVCKNMMNRMRHE